MRTYLIRLVLTLLLCCIALSGCGRKQAAPAEVLLDGSVYTVSSTSPEAEGPLRVYITLDGEALLDLPFDEAHEVIIRQADGAENAVRLTGEAVYMEHANCDNQDCVDMGAVTEENLEMRVMGGFIICLPHRVSVEVRGR